MTARVFIRLRSFLCIMAFLPCPTNIWPQALISQLPPRATRFFAAAAAAPASASSDPAPLPDAPDSPIAEVIPAPPSGVPVRLEYEHLEKHGAVYTLTGAVKVDYKQYTLLADKVVYDQSTGDANAEGHVSLEGGPDNEFISADSGTVNLESDTARFVNVVGSFGGRVSKIAHKKVYNTSNPFIFTGRIVVKEGPMRYRVIGGSMTSCNLPQPDWSILASTIHVDNGLARAQNGFFKFLGVPLLYLPYVTHSVDAGARESGLLIPVISNSSTKGFVFGDAIYWVINRSADATFGTQYFSKRGFSPQGEFRYHGRGEDFAALRFTALFDRGAPSTNLNQGGQDVLFNGRHDFDLDGNTRAVVASEYLSSYVYREAFAESFALAVASEVSSSAFLTRNSNGLSSSVHFDRYQNFQGILQEANSYSTPEIQILHLPSLDFNVITRSVKDTPAVWDFSGSAAGLERSEPGFNSGPGGRLDLYPRIALPFHLDGWSFRPEIAVRETLYTEGQSPTSSTPTQVAGSVSRQDVEAGLDLRPPVVVRDFHTPWLGRLLGIDDVRHTIEPEVAYRFVAGINHFSSIPRFDAIDVASDTNELGFSLTQRLFLKQGHSSPCTNTPLPSAINGIIAVPSTFRECGGNTDAWLTWTLAAKYFFDPTFGGAVTPFRRNVLATTLDLTGVSFLGGPRTYSPLISRFKVRTSDLMDLEWDADYDTKAGRLSASNLFANYHRGVAFGGVGYSTLQALNPTFTSDLSSQVTKYNLLRLLLGFGNPAKAGLSAEADAGYDFTGNGLQYYGFQTTYNWNCCGLSLGYRRIALGAVRNESEPMFSFTLAGVGSAGRLRQVEQIF